ncbi:MAG TPA: TetR/AcrR family transcriptional regulator [Sphingobium sp.]
MIIDAALKLINEDGLDNFTLRALAKRLGVYPTAIYWHVPGRNELLSQVVALALQDVTPKRRNPDWRAHLKNILARLRKAIRTNPNIAPLIAVQMIANTNISFKFLDDILSILEQANCSGIHLVAAFNFVEASIVGFTTQEFAGLPGSEAEVWQKQLRDRLASVDQRRFPSLATNLPNLLDRAFSFRSLSGTERPLDDTFDLFLDAIVGGVEAMAAASLRG